MDIINCFWWFFSSNPSKLWVKNAKIIIPKLIGCSRATATKSARILWDRAIALNNQIGPRETPAFGRVCKPQNSGLPRINHTIPQGWPSFRKLDASLLHDHCGLSSTCLPRNNNFERYLGFSLKRWISINPQVGTWNKVCT